MYVYKILEEVVMNLRKLGKLWKELGRRDINEGVVKGCEPGCGGAGP